MLVPSPFFFSEDPSGAEPILDAAEERSAFATLSEVEERHIRRALALTDGKIHGAGGAGELLGIPFRKDGAKGAK